MTNQKTKKSWAMLNNKRPKEMKAWQDCQWRRVPCGLDDCPICGRVKQDRERHIKKGEDPDSAEAMFEDVGNMFKETMGMLKKDAAKHGIDLDNLEDVEMKEPPKPSDFPLYNEVMAWRNGVYDIAKASDDTSSAWLYSEAGEDLLWYANTIMAKTYRQLSNLWELEHDREEFMDLEHNYTGFVLNECFNIIRSALERLYQDKGPHAAKFYMALITLNNIREKMKAAGK